MFNISRYSTLCMYVCLHVCEWNEYHSVGFVRMANGLERFISVSNLTIYFCGFLYFVSLSRFI